MTRLSFYQRNALDGPLDKVRAWLEEISVGFGPLLKSGVNILGSKRVSPEHDSASVTKNGVCLSGQLWAQNDQLNGADVDTCKEGTPCP